MSKSREERHCGRSQRVLPEVAGPMTGSARSRGDDFGS